MLVTIDGDTGNVTRLRGDPAHPVTRGALCGKMAHFDTIVRLADTLGVRLDELAGRKDVSSEIAA